jgi:hypothetical protein
MRGKEERDENRGLEKCVEPGLEDAREVGGGAEASGRGGKEGR